MSEPDTPYQTPDLVSAAEEVVSGSPGKLLRSAREAAGVHIAALAGSLKISVNRLEALENDDFSALPDAVFARALASSICRTLDLDPTAVLKLMPKNEVFNFSSAGPGINASFKDGSRKTGRNYLLEHALRPMGIAVIVLLLGVLVVLFVPFGNNSPAVADQSAGVHAPSLEQQVPDDSALPMPASADLTVTPSESVVTGVVGTTEPTAAVSASTTVDLTATATTTASTVAVAAPEVPAAVNAAELLQFRALGESWVQVRDATKNVVFERTLAKGQTASATGVLPLTVVIGRADMTEVLVHGKPFELAAVAKENVARFEVKQ